MPHYPERVCAGTASLSIPGLWLWKSGTMPLYTPIGGSWLNMTDSIQGTLTGRALSGNIRSPPKRLITSAGRPAITAADKNFQLSRVVQEASCGWSVAPDNSQALASAVERAHSHPEEREQKGLRAHQYVTAHHSRQLVAAQHGPVTYKLNFLRRLAGSFTTRQNLEGVARKLDPHLPGHHVYQDSDPLGSREVLAENAFEFGEQTRNHPHSISLVDPRRRERSVGHPPADALYDLIVYGTGSTSNLDESPSAGKIAELFPTSLMQRQTNEDVARE